MKKVSILNYSTGNLNSIVNTLNLIGYKVCTVSSAEEISSSEVLLLPGVGAFDHAMKYLIKNNLVDSLNQRIKKNMKTIGICLGYHILCNNSSEGLCRGLSFFNSNVKELPLNKLNVGWSDVNRDKNSTQYYFCNKFYVPLSSKTKATYMFEGNIYSAMEEFGNVYGIQFHPEKSYDNGRTFLKELINR